MATNYTPHWTTRAFDSAKLFSIQLLTVGGSGALAKTAVAPLERVKILMQVQSMSTGHKYAGPWDALRSIGQREGFKAFYRGNGVNVVRLFPDVVLKFALHDQVKQMFAQVDPSKAPSFRDRLAISSTTGLLRTTIAYPLEVVRTRITADTSKVAHTALYRGITDCLVKTYKREGLGGLYKGYFLSAAGVVPYLAISFAAYDELKESLPDSKEFKASIWHPLAKISIGALATVLAQTVTFPIDSVRRRMQMSGSVQTHTQYENFWRCASSMLQREGVSSFYRGVVVNAVKTAPGAAVQFVAYDFIKTYATAIEHSTGRAM
mmetsp:Transcript_15731/g.44017  ORF Transcript_15731/g.44017 Transcript_15731/m.44017 type:complete len:320 (-) Transcript_15731:209-1168(-)